MKWSNPLFKLVVLLAFLSGTSSAFAQPDTTEIFELEYFFDVDPGFGSATTIALGTPDSLPSFVQTLNSAGLATGFHVLGFRARNLATNPKYDVAGDGSLVLEPFFNINATLRSQGQWGMTETRLIFVDQTDGAALINVDQIEYFFDADPGVGSATLVTAFSPNNTVSIVETLNSNGLAQGFHVLGMRARAEGGAWGTTETRLVFVDQTDGAALINVDQIEYFFDADPGVGSATLVTAFSPSNTVSIVETLGSNGLSQGFHVLGMRARAEGGAWGTTETRLVFVDQTDGAALINVDQIEYFFDEDPGVGAASLVTAFTPSNTVSILESLNSDTLSTGFHVVGMRARAEGGAWGTTETRLIFVDQSDGAALINVDQIEYFFDADPGVGSATLVTSFAASNAVSIVESLNANALATGFHILGMRARAEGGAWGTTETRMVVVDQSGTISDITELEYFVDDDPGFGLASAIPVTTPAPSVTELVSLNTDTLSAGTTREISFRARNAVGEWGVTESRTVYISTLAGPTVSSNDSITNTSPATIQIAFEEAVSDFAADDFTVENGSIEAPSFVDNGDNTFTVDVNLVSEGAVRLTIPDSAAFAIDDNNPSPEANFVIYLDLTAPTITVDPQVVTEVSPALSGTIDDDSASVSITVAGMAYDASTVGGGTWTLDAGVINPLPSGTYDVIATATDLAGNVANDATSSELTVDVVDFAVLPATAVTETSFMANWSGGVDVVSYQLDVSDQSDFSTFLPGFENFETAASSATVTDLDFATTYYYRARFVNTSSVVSSNSPTIAVKTLIGATTVADSLALAEIFAAVSPTGTNWETARLRDWDGVTLDAASSSRVTGLDISGRNAAGDLPNPFSGAVLVDNGLSELATFNGSNNALTGLLDFSITSVTNVNVANNQLVFSDLEPLIGTPTFAYAPQAPVNFIAETNPENLKDTGLDRLGTVRIAPQGMDYTLQTGLTGTNNVYAWTRDATTIADTDPRYTPSGNSLTVNTIAIDNMGLIGGEVTNTDLVDLTLTVAAENVFGVVDLNVELTDGNNLLPGSENFTGALLETEARSSGYDTLSRTSGLVPSAFTFEDVILGDYLCGIDPQNRELYVPTYFGDAFRWEDAAVIEVREAGGDPIRIAMTDEPEEETGPGNLAVVIEEDFGDDASRIDARRRAKKRKCGLRRRVSGGRTDQDGFELFAYGETDDNGQFQFGFLPQGTYQFFVEYPGIPIDESATVEFTVGELGISDTEFSLNAFAQEGGVAVTIDRVLGLILSYFKDLSVYPNPVEDEIKIRYRHLKSTDVQAELVDLTGKVKWEASIRSGYDGSLEVDVRDLSKGIYVLRFYDRTSRDENVVSFRIVVK